MLVYQATKQRFLQDAKGGDIEDVIGESYRVRTGSRPAPGEIGAWKESLLHMALVLDEPGIPGDCGVAVEYRIPQSMKRVDFIITGRDEQARAAAVIVELKRWSSSTRTDMDGIVLARRGGRTGETEGAHPSYQAWTYAALLKGFNEAVYEAGAELQPCAYLHNHPDDGEINHAFYAEHLSKAPLFLKGATEQRRLRDFIAKHVRQGDDGALLYQLEEGRIRPSRPLADAVLGLLKGQPEFVLIDDQKLVYEVAARRALTATQDGRKHVVVVQGGPGTGKSVVAINLLAKLTGERLNVRYVSKNAAPRAVYESKLAGSFKKSAISNFFSGSGSFTETPADTFDVLVVDEAHRLNQFSGLYGNLGENQIKELIRAARCTIFFADDDQVVTLKDIGHIASLRAWAQEAGAGLTELQLSSQFRCNGSDGYLAWLDDTFQLRPTANQLLDTAEFDFRVVDSPTELHRLIEQRNAESGRARVVAGYCWEWKSKKNPAAYDIEIPEHGYRRRWNLTKDGSLWIVAPESVSEVGCIHTCQGLELDYVGVIVGADLTVEGAAVRTVPKARAKGDQSLRGLKQFDKHTAQEKADAIIKNTYRTLFTRGMKGCYVYCVDPALAAHIRARLKAPIASPKPSKLSSAEVLPFRRLDRDEAKATSRAVPVIDLKFAAGRFEEAGAAEGLEWAELPDHFHVAQGMFVAQVVGESMNRQIPNGAWCLFRANPMGTRHGKVVVARHHAIDDPELGGRYTIKRYFSEKRETEDGWTHRRIELRPDSDRPDYQPIVIERAEEGEFAIVAELLAVLG
jgi:DUF2075 family protein